MAITELDIGGAEKAFVRIAQGLKRLDWDVRVISLREDGPLSESLRDSGIAVTALNAGGFLDVRAIWRMRRELKRYPADVLLTFLHQANIAGRIAGRLAGVKRIICGIRVADRRLSVVLPERMTARLVDRYVAVSHTVADVHCSICGITSQLMSVIPNGVDIDAIRNTPAADRSTLGYGSNDRVILCVGRLSNQKSPLDVLRAFHELKNHWSNSGHPIRLLFVGEGPLRSELERQVSERSLCDVVQISGWRSDVWSLMKAADVFVLASRWEGLPNVVLEAMASGLPVVASAVDGCKELIEDGVTGRLFPAGDIQQLAQCLRETLDSSVEAEQRASVALRRIEADCRWENTIHQFHQLLLQTAPAAMP